jgi:hypothetical protein
MKHKIKSHTNEFDIVEALLEGKDASLSQCLSTAQTKTVEQWAQIISAAQSDFRDTEQSIVHSVMDQINSGVERKVVSIKKKHSLLGQVNALAAMTLLVAGLFVATQVGPTSVETPFPLAQEVFEMDTVESINGTVVTSSSLPVTSISSKGGVVLSNHSSSESVMMTSALRLEAVNGNLRIDSL